MNKRGQTQLCPLLMSFFPYWLHLAKTPLKPILATLLLFLICINIKPDATAANCSTSQFFSELSSKQNCSADQLQPILGTLSGALDAIMTACGSTNCSVVTSNSCLSFQRDLFYEKALFACTYLTYVANNGGGNISTINASSNNTTTGSTTSGTHPVQPAQINY